VVPSLKLQQRLLEVGNHICPLLKLGVLRLHVVLKVDDPMGMHIHLLTGDAEQHTSLVPPMLGITKMMVNII
jgi:hypothetical protein